jgi:hypothetical protein
MYIETNVHTDKCTYRQTVGYVDIDSDVHKRRLTERYINKQADKNMNMRKISWQDEHTDIHMCRGQLLTIEMLPPRSPDM